MSSLSTRPVHLYMMAHVSNSPAEPGGVQNSVQSSLAQAPAPLDQSLYSKPRALPSRLGLWSLWPPYWPPSAVVPTQDPHGQLGKVII